MRISIPKLYSMVDDVKTGSDPSIFEDDTREPSPRAAAGADTVSTRTPNHRPPTFEGASGPEPRETRI